MLGNKSIAHVGRFKEDRQAYEALTQALHAPSLYDEALRALPRHGLRVLDEHIERDFSQPYRACPEVKAAWAEVYRNPERYWGL